jgi:hypothetical protein
VIRIPGLGQEVRAGLARVVLLAVGLLAILSYGAVGRTFYGAFQVPQGTGMTHLPMEEVTALTMFTAFGLVATLALAVALDSPSLVRTAAQRGRALLERRALVVVLAVAAALASFAIRVVVLGRAVTTDDEHTYRFIAQTLGTGWLTAPSPGADLDFFREQFVVLTTDVRYGKYPLGFPLLLMAGEKVGLEDWVVPALTGLLVILVYAAGSALFDRLTAALAAGLVAMSPQVVLTGATVLSQTASGVCLMAGLALLFAARKAEKPPFAILALAGACFGYGVFVRPLPGSLFAAVAGLDVAWRLRDRGWRAVLMSTAAFAVPAAAGLGLILAQNWAQSGDALTSGYQVVHGTGSGTQGLAAFVGGDIAVRAMSVASGLLRLQAWAFGWPLAPLLALIVWRRERTGLLWALIAASFAYRVVAPKAGVSATGPVYLFEIVPVLALLVAAGVVSLLRRDLGGAWPATALVAGAVVSLTMFVPEKVANLYSMGLAQRTPQLLLDRQGVRRAVVFQESIVPWQTRLSWAYYPRCNSPRLDDDVLYLHVSGRTDLARARELWQRRFPDRSAWLFEYTEAGPRLVPLDQAIVENGETTPPPRS